MSQIGTNQRISIDETDSLDGDDQSISTVVLLKSENDIDVMIANETNGHTEQNTINKIKIMRSVITNYSFTTLEKGTGTNEDENGRKM